MIKHILVKPETHKEVDKVRADEGLKTFDEAIKSLLARPDFTKKDLSDLMAACEIVDEEYWDASDLINKIKDALKDRRGV